MCGRRGLAAACSLLLALTLLPGGGPSAHAQSDLEEADRQAEEAERQAEEAERLVSEEVAERDRIEEDLFDALQRYEEAGVALAQANADLDRVAGLLAHADAEMASLEANLQTQAVAAYIQAVSAPASLIWATSTVEDALLVHRAVEAAQEDALGALGRLEVQRRELEGLRARFEQERQRVTALRTTVAQEAETLEVLFAQADQAVAEAYARARAAEQAYLAALDEVEAARAAEELRRRQEEERRRQEEERRRQEEERRRQEQQEREGQPAQDEQPADPRPLSARVEQWRPLVSTHFPTVRVEAALQVMQCESGGDPEAVNPYSGAAGLFQFLPGTWAIASVRAGVGDRSVFDGEANIIAADWLSSYYASRGLDPWTPWSCKPW